MHDMETTLTATHNLLMALGGAVILAEIARFVLNAGRDPLRGAPIRANTLSQLGLWVCLLAYAASGLVAGEVANLIVPDGEPEEAVLLSRSILTVGLVYSLVIIVCLVIARFAFRAGWRGFGLGRRSLLLDFRDAILGLLAAVCLCSLVAWMTETIIRLFSDAPLPRHSVFEALGDPAISEAIRAVATIGALFIAPIGEEMLFRGVLQTGLKRLTLPSHHPTRHRWLAILLTAVAFGLLHYPTPHYIPALITLGIILGYLYERTGSLTVPILLHMLFNGKSLLWNYLHSQAV